MIVVPDVGVESVKKKGKRPMEEYRIVQVEWSLRTFIINENVRM